MPSNPTLPEDVLEAALAAVRATGHYGPYNENGPYAIIDAVAPLIIEWARRDQAEIDARIARDVLENHVSDYAADLVVDAIAAQFTDETTGGQ